MWAYVLSILLDHWQIVAVALSGLVLFGAGYGCRVQQERPDVRVRTDTVTVDRHITRTDTVTKTVPQTVIRYKRDTVRVRDTVVTAPTGLDRFHLMPPSAVDVEGQEITVSYYNSTEQRWQQNIYQAEPRAWNWSLTAGGFYDPFAQFPSAEITAAIQYKRVGLEATAGLLFTRTSYVMAGITYDIIKR